MRLCVIDGRGGGLGKRLVQGLLAHLGEADELIALGTNEAATRAMQLAGANRIGTGEQQIRQTVPTVEVIIASVNLILPGAMLGEVTPGIAGAILDAPARKLLLPINRVRVEVVGVEAPTLQELINRTIHRVQALLRPVSRI
jgi:Domain of unknown function (DUF3842)